jgi:hypothetical protein
MAVGDLDGTFAWLDRMYEERTPWLIWMNEHPRYDGLRGDPRFQELRRKIGFTQAQIDSADARAGKRGEPRRALAPQAPEDAQIEGRQSSPGSE